MTSELFQKIFNQLQKRSKLWFIVWIFLFLVVPILLIEIHIFVINRINSGAIVPSISRSLFYTNTTNPSIPSLFLSNYVHIDWSHCFGNIEAYFCLIALIVILETFWLFPKNDYKKESDFYLLLVLFFLVFPFSISGVSVIIFRINGGPEFAGFSGIVSCFSGYFWFLIYENLLFSERTRIQEISLKTVKIFDSFMIICFFIPILILRIINFLSYDNFGGHTIGYVLGFFSAFGMYLARTKKYDKIIISLIFAIAIWTTSTFWIFF